MILNNRPTIAIIERNHIIIIIISSFIPLDSITLLGRLEEGQGKLLKNDTDIKINQPGAGNIDTNTLDGKPEKELLSGHARQISNLGKRDGAGDVALISDMGLELGLAGGRIDQMEVEAAGGGVDGEGGDALGKKANRESVGFEDVVEGGGGGGEVMVSGGGGEWGDEDEEDG